MSRRTVLLSLTFSLAFPLAVRAAGPSLTAEPSAEEVVAKNVAARGGLDAWRAVQSLGMAGRMDAGRGMQIPFQLELKRPRKMRLEMKFQGETAVQTYDGAAGFKRMPFLGKPGAEALSAEELQAAASQAELDGPLVDYVAKGYRVELVGREPVEGRDAYKLKVTLGEDRVRHVWVDAETLLEAKVDGTRRVRGADRPLATYYRDYRQVAGLLVPHVLETGVEGAPSKQKLVIDTVVVNPALDDSRFGRP